MITLFVEFFVVFALVFSVGFGWYHGLSAHRMRRCHDIVGIVSLVRQKRRDFAAFNQRQSLRIIGSIAAGKQQPERVSKRIA